MKLDVGLKAVFTTGGGLFVESVFAPACSSFCCINLKRLLLGFCCKPGALGGAELGFNAVPPPLSSFTQLGLELSGFGKAGLESDIVEVRGGLLKRGFCRGPLASEAVERFDLRGVCCLLTNTGLLLVLGPSLMLANLLARALALFGSCTSVSLLVDGVFFRKDGFGGVFIAPPEMLSKTGFFCTTGPVDVVGCRGCLVRPPGVEEVSSMLAPLVWKRAMIALISALFS